MQISFMPLFRTYLLKALVGLRSMRYKSSLVLNVIWLEMVVCLELYILWEHTETTGATIPTKPNLAYMCN